MLGLESKRFKIASLVSTYSVSIHKGYSPISINDGVDAMKLGCRPSF